MRKYYRSALSFGLLSVLIVGLAFVLSGCSFLNQPPNAAFTWEEGSNPYKVSFDATGSSDPDGTIEAYEWVFGDGTTGSGSTIDHTYDNDGEYNVKLTVTDNGGATNSITKQVTIDNLTAFFTIDPDPATVDEEVTFDASGSTGDIDTYTWYPMSEQSEGVTLSGETATYTYTQTGSFTVELEVEDSEGSAMYGRSLEVEAS